MAMGRLVCWAQGRPGPYTFYCPSSVSLNKKMSGRGRGYPQFLESSLSAKACFFELDGFIFSFNVFLFRASGVGDSWHHSGLLCREPLVQHSRYGLLKSDVLTLVYCWALVCLGQIWIAPLCYRCTLAALVAAYCFIVVDAWGLGKVVPLGGSSLLASQYLLDRTTCRGAGPHFESWCEPLLMPLDSSYRTAEDCYNYSLWVGGVCVCGIAFFTPFLRGQYQFLADFGDEGPSSITSSTDDNMIVVAVWSLDVDRRGTHSRLSVAAVFTEFWLARGGHWQCPFRGWVTRMKEYKIV